MVAMGLEALVLDAGASRQQKTPRVAGLLDPRSDQT